MMHSRRRRVDLCASRLLVGASLLGPGAILASCSSGDDPGSAPDPGSSSRVADAGADTSTDAPNTRDAWVDATPLPVTCNSEPCATSLVTTLGVDVDDDSEGFCALLSDRTVACWGANGGGQLGRGDDAGTLDSANAARVSGLSDVHQLDHTCAVDGQRAVWCWGTGPFLRGNTSVPIPARSPVKLDLPAATRIAIDFAIGCAEVDAGIHCWGSNTDGQLGPPATSDAGGQPRSISIPPGTGAVAMAVGRATFVLRDDGTLVTWGANPSIGRLSSLFPDPYPQNVDLHGVVMADIAHDSACAVAGGIGYCWGTPDSAVVQSPIDRALPVPVVTPEPVVQIATTRSRVLEGLGVQRHRWCAAGISGAVYCWGLNESGQAGDGTMNYAFDAVRVERLPERAVQVKTTPNTTCVLLTNGKIYCWGGNYNGQLGNGQGRGRSFVPVEVALP